MRGLLPRVILVTIAAIALGGTALAQQNPEFRLGFKSLADQIPRIVGTPIEDEHYDVGGDSVQQTTTGLMVWRKYDRWTAFTNGSVTWILGPYGLQSRLNTQLYPWEQVPPGPSPVPQPQASPAAAPAPPTPWIPPTPVGAAPPAATQGVPPTPEPAVPPTATPWVPPTPMPLNPAPAPPAPAAPQPAAPPASNRTYSPDVKAMDELAGPLGASIKQYVQGLDDEWARIWGWRPHRPVTFYLYTDGQGMAYGYTQITGRQLLGDDFYRFAAVNAVATGDDVRTGGWSILVNLYYQWGSEDWQTTMNALLVHEYGLIMQADLAGGAGPQWFREGLAEWIAYSRVPSSTAEKTIVFYAMQAKANGTLPTLPILSSSWSDIVGAGGEQSQAAYGASYLAVKYLTGRVGGLPLLQALQRTAAGQPFDAALQEVCGYSTDRLEGEYRNSIPSP